jgi:hypothetical protein
MEAQLVTGDEVFERANAVRWRLASSTVDGNAVYQWRSERWGYEPAFGDREQAILWMHDWLGRAGMAY